MSNHTPNHLCLRGRVSVRGWTTGFKRTRRDRAHRQGRQSQRNGKTGCYSQFKAICATETVNTQTNVFLQTAGHNGVPDRHSAALPVQDELHSSGKATHWTCWHRHRPHLLKSLKCLTVSCSLRCRSESSQATVTR